MLWIISIEQSFNQIKKKFKTYVTTLIWKVQRLSLGDQRPDSNNLEREGNLLHQASRQMESHCAWIWRNAPWQCYQTLKKELQREASLYRQSILHVAQACTMKAIYKMHLYSCSNDWRECSSNTPCHCRRHTQLVSICCSCKSLNMVRTSMIIPLG